jgi:hypothetical protein
VELDTDGSPFGFRGADQESSADAVQIVDPAAALSLSTVLIPGPTNVVGAPKKEKTKQSKIAPNHGNAAKKNTGLAVQGAETAELKNAKFKGEEIRPSEKEITPATNAAEALSLASSAQNTIASINQVINVFSEPHTASERFWTVIGGLKSMADVSRGVLEKYNVGQGVSSTLLQSIPGLGLAIGVVSLADTLLNKVKPLCEARRKQEILLKAKIEAPALVGVAMVPVVMVCAITSKGVIHTSRLNRNKNLNFDIF